MRQPVHDAARRARVAAATLGTTLATTTRAGKPRVVAALQECGVTISTQNLHARGPMGLTEMTTTTYLVTGSGQVR